METVFRYLAVGAGGALGAMARYALGNSFLAKTAMPFPTPTFVINLTGSFLLTWFVTVATARGDFNPYLRLAFSVGFVGAYTTFSTFELETIQMFRAGRGVLAAMYVVSSVLVGLLAGLAGIWLGGGFAAEPIKG